MDKAIENEQIKLAEHFGKLPIEEKQKQGLALMCWLQGYETGFPTRRSSDLKAGRTEG